MKIMHHRKLIAGNAVMSEHAFSNARGLMFTRKLKKGDALILAVDKESIPDTAIHMLFVFFPIDVVWLDKNKRVVDFRKNVKPFTPFIKPREAAQYVVELPKNTIRNINIGDRFQFS